MTIEWLLTATDDDDVDLLQIELNRTIESNCNAS